MEGTGSYPCEVAGRKIFLPAIDLWIPIFCHQCYNGQVRCGIGLTKHDCLGRQGKEEIMLTTSLNLAEKYDYLEEKFRKGYEFLRNTDLKALLVGRVDIDGDALFASVQEYTTMAADTCKYEAHNRYFDIQYIVEGEEQFGYAKRADLVEEAPYDEADDMVLFKEPDQGGTVYLKAGDCIVVAPEDAHKPRCMAGKPCKVKKIVLKVHV